MHRVVSQRNRVYGRETCASEPFHTVARARRHCKENRWTPQPSPRFCSSTTRTRSRRQRVCRRNDRGIQRAGLRRHRQAGIEFTDPRYREKFDRFPFKHARLRSPAAVAGPAATEDRTDRDPGGGTGRATTTSSASARRRGSSPPHAAPFVSEVGRGREGPGRQALRGLRRLPPLLEHQPEGGQEARHRARAVGYVDGIRFQFAGRPDPLAPRP